MNSMLNRLMVVVALVLSVGVSAPSEADPPSPFEGGWLLDPAASDLRVMSIKKSRIAESSPFRTLAGSIAEDGTAEISVFLDSIDTGVDLRNVRMRFLFFETFNFPKAKITAKIDPAAIAGLYDERTAFIDFPYEIELRGLRVKRVDRVSVTVIDANTVLISSANPIPLALADFNLEEGRQKLEEAANVDIVPLGTVSFNFLFRRQVPIETVAENALAAAGTSVQTVGESPRSVALESQGALDQEGCVGRFEILSRTGNIYFGSGSADIEADSEPLLKTLLDVVERCPSMRVQISGHTDSDGSSFDNKRLSESRAKAVQRYLEERGVATVRLRAVGFGEQYPIVPNNSAANKRRNRRIEFEVIDN